MLHFNGTLVGKAMIWELIRYDDDYIDDGVTVSFPLPIQLNQAEAINFLKAHLPEWEKAWIRFTAKKWTINLSAFKAFFLDGLTNMIEKIVPERDSGDGIIYLSSTPTKLDLKLFEGDIDVIPEVSHRDISKASRTTVNFIFNYDALMDNQPKRIFLSHKSADKPMVRGYKDMLKSLGFDPWMDEDDLIAGDKLHRGILKGFHDSCAAIFFVTKNYVDERFLATEVDYAMDEHYKKGEQFRVITLVIGEDGQQPEVPSLLNQFVYKTPKNQFEGLTEVLKALPLKIDGISFKV